MRRLIVVAGLAARLAAGASTVAETRLTAPRATQLAQGTITICANALFTSLNDVVVDPGVCTTARVVNGAFTVALEPTPAGIRYTAKWDLDGGTPRSEQWFVPAAATTLRLRDVQMGTGVIADAWRGAWDVAVGYSAYDKVSYGGSSWIAIASSTGVTPGTNAAKWGLLAAKGDTGATGETGVVAATAPVTYDADTRTVACPTCVPNTRTVNGHALGSDVTVTKADVGLGSASDTADADKPVSTATQAALDLKEPTITGGLVTEYWAGTKVWRNFSADVLSAMAAAMGLKAPLASPVFTGQPTIADFTLAGHSHENTAGGGTLDAAAIAAGVLAIGRIPTGTSGSTVAFGNHTHDLLYLGLHATADSATSATTATHLAGGTSGQFPYQSGVGATSFRTPNAANGPLVLDPSGNAVLGAATLRGGGASLPASCSVGDTYFLTTGTTGWYSCTATNSWTLPGGHSIAIPVAGNPIGTGTANVGIPSAPVQFACTINKVTVSANASGSLTVDIWKRNNALPSGSNKISASAPATLSSAQFSVDLVLTGWTTSVSTNDVFWATVATADGVLTSAAVVISCQ